MTSQHSAHTLTKPCRRMPHSHAQGLSRHIPPTDPSVLALPTVSPFATSTTETCPLKCNPAEGTPPSADQKPTPHG